MYIVNRLKLNYLYFIKEHCKNYLCNFRPKIMVKVMTFKFKYEHYMQNSLKVTINLYFYQIN